MHRQLDLDRLFWSKRLDAFIEGHERTWVSKVDGLSSDAILRRDHETMATDLAETYAITVPTLSDNVETTPEEMTVDMSSDAEAAFLHDHDRGPLMVKGTVIAFHVPFTGDAQVFECEASTHSSNPPRATLAGEELHLNYFTSDHDAEGIQRAFAEDIRRIKEALTWAEPDVARYMTGLRERIVRRLQARKDKLGKDQSLAESIGFRVRRRAEAPDTLTPPAVKRKAVARPLRGLPGPKPVDPILESEEYDYILRICASMVKVMERSPRAFSHMDEEAIRHSLLLPLNMQYEGGATGETFNGQGKTDILIRVEDRNVFIAECKFWTGPKSLADAIDQLLGYATWRDSKTAIFVFNRSRQLSTVLSQLPEVVRTHAAFVRQLDYAMENAFRFVLKRPDDPARELLLTVMVFEVPTADGQTAASS